MAIALMSLLALLQEEKGEIIAVKGGKVYTVSKGVVEDGVLLIENGKIAKVGKGLDVPLNAKVIEIGKGASVTPGFIDLHSHLGSLFEIEEKTEAVTPQVRALDAFSTGHPDVARALASGVTLVTLAPGNSNLVSGRAALLRLNGTRLDRMIFRESVALKISLTGEALLRDREPTSKSGAMKLLRALLRDPKSGLGQSFCLVHAVAGDEIQNALALKKEFGLRMVLLHADEAGRVLEDVKNADVPIAFGPLTVSDRRERLETPGKLARAGVRVAFVTDAPESDEAYLRVTAALAVKSGMDKGDALRALTLSAAEMLGVADVLGSLEEGKHADLVVYAGEPLSLSSDVEVVIVGGRVVYQKKKG